MAFTTMASRVMAASVPNLMFTVAEKPGAVNTHPTREMGSPDLGRQLGAPEHVAGGGGCGGTLLATGPPELSMCSSRVTGAGGHLGPLAGHMPLPSSADLEALGRAS